jgi:hypothetical protein
MVKLMKYKLPLILLVLCLTIFFLRRELSYPPEWNQIHAGMSRQEVYDLIGPGGGEFAGWKGPFWRDSKLVVWHELDLSMSGDKVVSVRIHRYLGEHHPF